MLGQYCCRQMVSSAEFLHTFFEQFDLLHNINSIRGNLLLLLVPSAPMPHISNNIGQGSTYAQKLLLQHILTARRPHQQQTNIIWSYILWKLCPSFLLLLVERQHIRHMRSIPREQFSYQCLKSSVFNFPYYKWEVFDLLQGNDGFHNQLNLRFCFDAEVACLTIFIVALRRVDGSELVYLLVYVY